MVELHVLFEGYVREGDELRVGSTVGFVRDGDAAVIIDPGLVPSPAAILDPLRALGVEPDAITDVVFSHHHPDHTV
ncbi:MAG TPA: MBL fold metallo-hydrolase, partial [Actinomycetota bacterium]|nr:MBL fold metallo-hydrolase [Actinomycetota bacterium]